MRILFVADVSIERVIGGAERVLSEQTTRLAKKGHIVYLITRLLPEHQQAQETINGVHEVRCKFDACNPAGLVNLTWPEARRQFFLLHDSIQFDCVNVHQSLTAYGLMSSAVQRGLPRIYTCHSFSFEEYLSRNQSAGPAGRVFRRLNAMGRRLIEQRVLNRCDPIVTLSRYTQERLDQEYRVRPDRVRVIPAGVDLVRFHPVTDKAKIRAEFCTPPDRFILLTVRNLVPRMGLDRLLLAMQTVVEKIPHALLIIGGRGPLKDHLSAHVERLALTKHVHMAGFIPEDQLPRYYQMADLFVLPTQELEGFGMVTLEALASGLPVLGTPVGGTNEILPGLDRRLLLSDSNPQTMAQGIIDYHQQIQKASDGASILARRCRQYAETRYSWDAHVTSLEALFSACKVRAPKPGFIQVPI
jgi:glycosyltransferase involved in cell wall biosynthesis